MKTNAPVIATLLCSTLAVLAQGTVNFSTRVTGTVVGHVYFNISEPFKTGNTASETPAGSQTYLGPQLEGSGYCAQLWAASGIVTDSSFLVAVPGSVTTFRTGATLRGTPAPIVVSVPQIPPGGTGTFQVRAWDNASGTILSFDRSIGRGASALFTISNLGDGVLTLPADMANFRSFSFYPLPEPSSVALLGFGGFGLLVFGRKLAPVQNR